MNAVGRWRGGREIAAIHPVYEYRQGEQQHDPLRQLRTAIQAVTSCIAMAVSVTLSRITGIDSRQIMTESGLPPVTSFRQPKLRVAVQVKNVIS